MKGKTGRGGRLGGWVHAGRGFLAEEVWARELEELPFVRRAFYRVARILYLAARGFETDKCVLRAGALTFITGLSFVPLLAFAFSVAKGLGAYDQLLNEVINPFLTETFGQAGEASATGVEVRAALDQVLTLVEGTDVKSLGTFGAAILFYTVLKLLGAIEGSLNDIWGVHRPRTLLRKISDYLSIVVVVPILLTMATAVTAGMQSEGVITFVQERLHLGQAGALWARLTSMFVTWIGFSFVYLFLPNTRVKVRSALLGGLIGGLLWQVVQVLHVQFQIGVANYNAIYSTFAAAPIFMFWLYLSWITVLLGAEVAQAHQSEPTYHQVARARAYDQPFFEVLSLRGLLRISIGFLRGDEPLRASTLADDLRVPERSLNQVLEKLRAAGVIAFSDEDGGFDSAILPARSLSLITVQDVLDALAGRGGPLLVPLEEPEDRVLAESIHKIEDERSASPHNASLETLARRAIEAAEGGHGFDAPGTQPITAS